MEKYRNPRATEGESIYIVENKIYHRRCLHWKEEDNWRHDNKGKDTFLEDSGGIENEVER